MLILKPLLALISIIFCIIGIYYNYRTKGYGSNIYSKRLGMFCYTCNSKIDNSAQFFTSVNVDNDSNVSNCLKCSREFKLSRLLLNYSYFKFILDREILLRRSEILSALIFIIVPIIFLTYSFFTPSDSFKNFSSIFNSICTCIYWSIHIYRTWLCSETNVKL